VKKKKENGFSNKGKKNACHAGQNLKIWPPGGKGEGRSSRGEGSRKSHQHQISQTIKGGWADSNGGKEKGDPSLAEKKGENVFYIIEKRRLIVSADKGELMLCQGILRS